MDSRGNNNNAETEMNMDTSTEMTTPTETPNETPSETPSNQNTTTNRDNNTRQTLGQRLTKQDKAERYYFITDLPLDTTSEQVIIAVSRTLKVTHMAFDFFFQKILCFLGI